MFSFWGQLRLTALWTIAEVAECLSQRGQFPLLTQKPCQPADSAVSVSWSKLSFTGLGTPVLHAGLQLPSASFGLYLRCVRDAYQIP